MKSLKEMTLLLARISFIYLSLVLAAPCAFALQSNAQNGLSWLRSNQGAAGNWGSLTPFRDTETVVDTMRALGSTDAYYLKAIDWVNSASAESNDYVARRIISRSGTGSDLSADINLLVTNQNPDGGWGYSPEYDSDAYDTAIVLQALMAAQYQNADVLKNAINYLSTNQNENGSWSQLADESGDVTTTALSAIILNKCQNSALPVPLTVLSKATAWLATKQNPDGGFGSSPSTIYETSLALSALIENGHAQAQPITSAMNYLAANQNVNGSWDNSPYETGLAVKTLAMLKPNLSVTVPDIALSNNTPLSGDMLRITVTIRNSGTASAQNIPVKVFSETIGGQQIQIGTTQVLTTLGIGAISTVAVDFDTTGKDGSFSLIVKADPDNTIEELSKSDNQASLNINITPRKPDLLVNSTDLTLANLSPKSGDVVKINAVIRNIGNSDAVNVPVLVLAESAAHVISQVGSQTIPLVTTNGSASVEVDFDTTGKEGAYTVALKIDPENLIDEFAKTNNQVSATLSILPLKPDLIITAADFTAVPAAAKSGEIVKITGTVRNAGTTSALHVPVRIVAESPAHDLTILAFPTIPEIPVNGSFVVTADLNTTNLQGSYAISLQIDPENSIVELSKANNQTSFSVAITPVPDLVLTSLVASKNSLNIGEDVSFTATIGNHGNSAAGVFDVTYYVNSVADANFIGSTSIPALNPGESAVRTMTWKSSVAGNGIKVFAVADPGNKVAEADKANNQVSQTIDVAAVTDANLTVSYKDVTLNPPLAKQGGAVEITALVKNTGFSAADAVDVVFYKGDPKADGVFLAKQTIPTIAPGDSASVTYSWPNIAETGTKLIYVVADPANSVKEFNEEDNTTFAVVNIRSLPDLAISDSSVTISPDYPVAGKNATVNLIVANKGDQDAENVTVQLRDEISVFGSQVIPLIRGNTLTTVTLAYPTTGRGGSHTLTVVLDPDNMIVEQNKGNNSATKPLVVRNGKLWVSEAYFSPNGDGVKDSTDIFFSLDAPATVKILVTNIRGDAVRTFSGGELDNTAGRIIAWDGKNDSGVVVSDGEYQIRIVDTHAAIIGDLAVVIDTNRAPFSEAIGTKFLLNTNLTCSMPVYAGQRISEDRMLFSIRNGSYYTNYGYVPPYNGNYSEGVYVNSLNGAESIKVSSSDSDYFLSPDKQKIAFTKVREIFTHIYSPDVERTELWTVDADGTGLSLVGYHDVHTSFVLYGPSISIVSWSPDMKYIGYLQSQFRVLPQNQWVNSRKWGLKQLPC